MTCRINNAIGDFMLSPAVELAVSIETAGETPAQPTAPFVYRGLCGKLWKSPPN